MNKIAFMTANYVARQSNYHMTDWGSAQDAVVNYFKPVETYQERLNEILTDIVGLGFDTIDLWLAHLDPAWATSEHVTIAKALLKKHGLQVASLAGWFGDTLGEFEAICKLAKDVNATVLGGQSSLYQHADTRTQLISMLKDYDLRLGIENHPQKSPQEMLDTIGDDHDGTIGTAVDTGWWGVQGFDAAQAIRDLGDTVFCVHLKDVKRVGTHDSCTFGEGIVPVEECVRVLQEIGCDGVITIEHEPEDHNPNDDIRESLTILKGWLSS